MRIAFLNPIATLGGAEQSLLELLTELRQFDFPYEQHLIVGADGPLLAAAASLGVICHLLPMPAALSGIGDATLSGRASGLRHLLSWGAPAAIASALYVRRLRALLRRIRPDVVQGNGLKSDLLASLARPPGVPVVWYVHDFLGSRPLARRLLRLTASPVRHVLANSYSVAGDLRACLGRVPIQVLYYGIDVQKFSPGNAHAADLDEMAGLSTASSQVLRVGLVATYAKWKGHQVVLDAAHALIGQDPELSIRFYLVGGPIYQTAGSQYTPEELRAMIAERGLSDRVGLVPFRNDPTSCYRALDIVVHASTKPEPFGRTIVEAMACGRPVIVSQAGGAAETFREGVEAIGTPPGDVQALARAIRQLALDSPLRSSLGHNARESAVRRFSRARMGQEARDFYCRLIPESAQSKR